MDLVGETSSGGGSSSGGSSTRQGRQPPTEQQIREKANKVASRSGGGAGSRSREWDIVSWDKREVVRSYKGGSKKKASQVQYDAFVAELSGADHQDQQAGQTEVKVGSTLITWGKEGSRDVVKFKPAAEEIERAQEQLKGATRRNPREKIKAKLKDLLDKVFAVGAGDAVELHESVYSQYRIGEVIKLFPEDNAVLLHMFADKGMVGTEVKKQMHSGEVLKSRKRAHCRDTMIKAKVDIQSEKPSGKTCSTDGVRFCTRAVTSNGQQIVEAPDDLSDSFWIDDRAQADTSDMHWWEGLSEEQRDNQLPQQSETDKANSERVARVAGGQKHEPWSTGGQQHEPWSTDFRDEGYLKQAMELVTVEPGMLVLTKPRGGRWGLVTGVTFGGELELNGNDVNERVLVDRQAVMVPGAREFALHALAETKGRTSDALAMIPTWSEGKSFLFESMAGRWTSEQVRSLMDISIKFDEQDRKEPLGEDNSDGHGYGVEGKPFRDVVDAWHRFKPETRWNGKKEKDNENKQEKEEEEEEVEVEENENEQVKEEEDEDEDEVEVNGDPKGKKRANPAPRTEDPKRVRGTPETSGTSAGSGGAASRKAVREDPTVEGRAKSE